MSRFPRLFTVDNHPIFVVGAPRSGTTLLAAMLAGHSRIMCGPETQFFNKLDADQLADAVQDPRWPRLATSAICSLTLARQSVVKLFGLSRRDVRRYLRNRSPSVRAMVESLTESYATRNGKPRWAEKTPNHILHVAQIRGEWPEAPIVRIVRDPRDVALSMRQLMWTRRNSILDNAGIWADWHEQAMPFFSNDRRSYTLRFEDLVTEPETELRRLCEVIDEEYEPGMLDTGRSGKAVASKKESWKASVSGPVDASRASGWRGSLSEVDAEAVAARCATVMRSFGYSA
jgi:sulfotransferase family protein